MKLNLKLWIPSLTDYTSVLHSLETVQLSSGNVRQNTNIAAVLRDRIYCILEGQQRLTSGNDSNGDQIFVGNHFEKLATSVLKHMRNLDSELQNIHVSKLLTNGGVIWGAHKPNRQSWRANGSVMGVSTTVHTVDTATQHTKLPIRKHSNKKSFQKLKLVCVCETATSLTWRITA